MNAQELQDYMLECEASEWIRRFRKERLSRSQGFQRINKLIFDIEKIRGRVAAQKLRQAIERQLLKEKEGRA